MAQDLFYTPAQQSLVLIRPTEPSPYYWYDITSLQISGSAYDATISGSDFGGTAATARIYAYSGSTNVVSFPLEDTNLYYPPFPNLISLNNFYPTSPLTESYSGFYWDLTIDSSFSSGELSGSGLNLYDSSSATTYLSYNIESSTGAFSIISGNTYILSVSGSGSFDLSLTLNNITSGSMIAYITSSTSPISASFVPLAYNDYEAIVSVINNYLP
jgi:hypothetical protein